MNLLSEQFNRLRSLRLNIYLFGLSIIILLNVFVLKEEFRRIYSFKKIMKHQIIGHKFAGLDEFTKEINVISYFTDQDLKTNAAGKDLAQAQLLLTPTIVDADRLDHEYVLLVCKNEINALRIMKQLNLIPLRRNQHGIILARRQS